MLNSPFLKYLESNSLFSDHLYGSCRARFCYILSYPTHNGHPLSETMRNLSSLSLIWQNWCKVLSAKLPTYGFTNLCLFFKIYLSDNFIYVVVNSATSAFFQLLVVFQFLLYCILLFTPFCHKPPSLKKAFANVSTLLGSSPSSRLHFLLLVSHLVLISLQF